MKSGLIFTFGLVVIIFGCDKPTTLRQTSSPIIFSVSLRDSLPQNTFRKLRTGDVMGVCILDTTGNDVRYFEYKTNPHVLLDAIALSSFDIEGSVADTQIRRLDQHDLESVEFIPGEDDYSRSFFETDHDYEVFESIKPPLKHLIRINKETNVVLHRISKNVN